MIYFLFPMKSTKPSISDKFLGEILRKTGHARSFGAGEQIFAEGETALVLPFVLEGRVKMVRFPEIGKEVIVSVFSSGEMFAVPPVFDGGPYPATAVAMEDSELLLVGRDDFLRLLRESSDFSFAVIGWMCGMLREKTAVIEMLATASPEHRVGNVLLRLLKKKPASAENRVKISLRRQDIAEMAGLTTETTIRAARRLAAKDLIKIVHGKIILDEPERLKKFLDS